MAEEPNNNGISTADEFRNRAEKLAQERRLARAEELTLPSGLKILAARPEPKWYLTSIGSLPKAQLHRNGDGTSNLSAEEVEELAGYTVKLIQEVFVRPIVKRKPGPGEVDPSWISDDDLMYVLKYAGGEIEANGQSLEPFSAKRTVHAPGSSGGGPVEDEAIDYS